MRVAAMSKNPWGGRRVALTLARVVGIVFSVAGMAFLAGMAFAVSVSGPPPIGTVDAGNACEPEGARR